MSFTFHPSSLRPLPALVALVCAGQVQPILAAESFVIRDIRIEGLQRGDPGSVFGALPFRVGDTYTDDKGASALRALFATGLFKDVRLDIEDKVVVVVVDERAVVASVNFVGLREFDKDQLTKALKENGVGEGLPFDKAVVDRAEQEIKRQYLSKSFYGSEVVTTATPIERNRVNVTFTVVEGDVAKIKEVRVLGTQAVSESDLLSEMDLTAGGWLTWYTKTDRYARTKLNADLEKIRSYYLNRGFLEFDVKSTQVTISPDKQDISITIAVTEGQPYTVTAVRLEGEYLGREVDFRQRVLVRPGQAYRGDDVTATIRQFTDHFGTYGYAFARVEPRTEIDRKTGQVVVVLQASPGQRVNVRRVNVAGNTVTRDEVLRREFRQYESAWYDGAKIKLSRDRVERLGYFTDVNVDTNEVPGAPDQVDLTVNVTEKPTGSLMLAAGYSQVDKLTISASISKENIFGSGNSLALGLNTGKTSRNLSLSTTDPYFTDDGVSRTLDLYYKTSKPLNSLAQEFQLATAGSAIRFGVPFTEYDTVFMGVGAEQNIIGTSAGLPQSYIAHRVKYGSHSLSIPLTVGWSRDERANPLTPTRGKFQRLSLDFSLLGDLRYAKVNAQYQQYIGLPWKLTLGLNGEVGMGYGIMGRDYPTFKNFYGGGLGSVRVFESGSFGGRDITGAYDGGSRRLNLNAELYVPVPGSGNDKSLRIFGFADAGNVWRTGNNLGSETSNDVERGQTNSLNDLRASAGVGLSWTSPVGPLKISYGLPLRSFKGDKIQRFQFQIGSAF